MALMLWVHKGVHKVTVSLNVIVLVKWLLPLLIPCLPTAICNLGTTNTSFLLATTLVIIVQLAHPHKRLGEMIQSMQGTLC